ncbi:MAG: hypothetical protein JWO77_996 [Ilumatobacteraceae bacterium]|nr:hypothetical protein [Ilumatobacteraceae bacterium]
MFPTALPIPSRHRLAGVLAALALSGLALVAGATPASATDEFPAQPTASATIGCNDGGSMLTIQLGNVAGLSSAQFAIGVTGLADDTVDLPAGATTTIQHFGLPENSDVTVSISADPGLAYTEEFSVNCFDFVGGITLTCDGDQPVITAEATAIGTYGDNLSLHVNGAIVSSGDLAAGSSTTFTAPVPDEVPFTSELVSVHDGTITDLSGTPHCAPAPTTTTTSSTTSTTVAAPVVPTDPPSVLPAQLPQPAPYVAPTELARTGSSTAPLALLGATLLGLGITFRRIAARRA